MGICLDTEQNNGSQMFEGQNNREAWNQEHHQDLRYINTPPDGEFPMHNSGAVQFEIPKVPVIFVLGGPGSGKVTHCDNLMQEKRGVAHINMTDLLQQYAIGNDMQDFSQLSSKTVTEVLMLEMKMAPAAKTYLVSGYPRNMRDVVEYSEKIQVVSGVILVSWRQKVLERQIDYGAKLGQVVLSLARMELNNFYKNVMPVADYFDQSGMLIAINGERHPGEVYKDFHAAVMRILGMQDNPPILANGPAVTVPNEIEPVVDQATHNDVRHIISPPVAGAAAMVATGSNMMSPSQASTEVITVKAHDTPSSISPVKPGWPPVIWVIGGPGSNKATLCTKAAQQRPGWVHISLGKLLRTAAENADSRSIGNDRIIRQNISIGEMVPPNIIMQILETHMAANMSKNGVIIDGYPRDLKQVNEFEMKFKQKPSLILLDCSKLQLGRGRLDDSVAAFRRRLELFRELSLPMLKSLDGDGRLTIVDGDTDASEVQEDFNAVIREQMDKTSRQMTHNIPSNLNQRRGTFVEDLEAVTGLATISSRVPNNISNGISNGVAHGTNYVANGGVHPSNQSLTNRFLRGHATTEKGSNLANGNAIANGYGPSNIPNGVPARNQVGDVFATYSNQKRENIKNMYNEIDGYSNHI